MLLPLLASWAALVLGQEQEHFLDVKQIVKGTIEAMSRLPNAAALQNQNTSTQKPEDIYQLFRLPADIMTKLAVETGYLDEPTTTTNGPWIVARPRGNDDDDSGEWEEVRHKRRRKRPEDDGLLSLKDLLKPLPPVQQPILPAPQAQQQPLPQQPMAQPQSQPTALPQTPFMPQSDPVQTSQDPLYRREVTSDGQVRFVPVFSQTTAAPSPFMVASPAAPHKQSNQRFEAPTFPPQINPFQPQGLPPRIVLPPSAPVASPPAPAVEPRTTFQLPMADPVTPPTTTSAPEAPASRRPVLIQPVIRHKSPKPQVSETTTTESQKVMESGSLEDDSVVHSEESEITTAKKKSIVTTALRVRTIEHSKSAAEYSEEEEEVTTQKPKRKPSHPAKKRAKIMESEEEPTTSTTVEPPPTAEKPSQKFVKEMEGIEEKQMSRRRRVHASKTLRMGRKGNKELKEVDERISDELEQLSGENEVMTTVAPKRRRKSKKTKPTTTTTTTTTTEATTTTEPTTTTEEETTTVEMRRTRKKSGKHGKRKSRRSKKVTTTTTTLPPLVVSPQHCSNLRSFARQFGVLELDQFARKHCEFIENYYAELTCDNVDEYVAQCEEMRTERRRRE